MAMRINPTVPSFYNAGRVNNAERNSQVNSVEKVSPVGEAQGIESLSAQRSEELYRPNRGVVQTKVSPENSFQKAMVTDPSFALERMAGKLMDKLPNILRDMENLPEDSGFEVAGEAANAGNALAEQAPSRVVISEDGRMSGQAAAAPAQENISL